MQFRDGDRLVVRMHQPATKYQMDKLADTIKNWAVADVHVLVIPIWQWAIVSVEPGLPQITIE
jgi:hypothetical protein